MSELTSSKTHGDTIGGMCIVGNSWKAGDGGSSRHKSTFACRVSANKKQINGRVKIKIKPVLTINNDRKIWEVGDWIITLPGLSQMEASGDRQNYFLWEGTEGGFIHLPRTNISKETSSTMVKNVQFPLHRQKDATERSKIVHLLPSTVTRIATNSQSNVWNK